MKLKHARFVAKTPQNNGAHIHATNDTKIFMAGYLSSMGLQYKMPWPGATVWVRGWEDEDYIRFVNRINEIIDMEINDRIMPVEFIFNDYGSIIWED